MKSQEAQDQLDLIERTINQAKRSVHKGSGHFLIWGYGLAIAALLQYTLTVTEGAPRFQWVPWPAVALIGGVVAALYERSRGEDASEPTDRIFAYLWSAFGVTLFLIVLITVSLGQDPNPFVILLMGLPTFVSGGILRSSALLVGGASCWPIGTGAAFLDPPDTALTIALALLLAYVIPGHVLRHQERKEKLQDHG